MSTTAPEPVERPFVASPAGERTVTDTVAARAAEHWGLPAPVFVRRGMNALYTAGPDVMIRVGRPEGPPTAAAALADLLHDSGVRVPRPIGVEPFGMAGHTAFAIERLMPVRGGDGADTASDEHPDAWEEVGRMVARVHDLDPQTVRGIHPLPRAARFPWWDFGTLLQSTADLVDDGARRRMLALLAECGDWAERGEPEVVCHGDMQPHNVIVTADGPVLLDWDLLCRAPRAFDLAPLVHWSDRWGGRPGLVEAFVAGYGSALHHDPLTQQLGRLRLLAATLMRVAAGRFDPVARADAEERLRWWRGDPDAPMWTPR